jgi:3-deoxy-D-manno-octulosonic-acid transferase
MNVLKNSKENVWELWCAKSGDLLRTLPLIDAKTNKEAVLIFTETLHSENVLAKDLIEEILKHREDYSVILMPEWVDNAEELVHVRS